MPMDVPAAAWTAFSCSNTFDTSSSQLASIYYDMIIIIQSSMQRVFMIKPCWHQQMQARGSWP
jgi:hypothetical protein